MTANNSYRITVPPASEKYINIPLEIKWDFSGRDDDLQRYETNVIQELTASKYSFEIARYSHKEYGLNNDTEINYNFHFYNSANSVTGSTPLYWVNSYLTPLSTPSGFSVTEIYYQRKAFKNSFFKLDFYDTPESKTQKNYFTIIIPTQQGDTENASLSPLIPNVKIKKPSMFLDFVGDSEGFFLYWLRDRSFADIDTFYMSAKFFDAKYGVFVRMMNKPQSTLSNKFIFDTDKYFFYPVKIDYNTKKYEVMDSFNPNNRIGTGTPINWYEYINP